MNNTDKLAKVALKKSLLKEFSNSQNDRIVYLNNGDEFQIQFFNPFTYTIAAEIYLNNQVLSNKIVIRPGERIWLERYLDSPRKFKFDVYEVNNSEQVREAIANNGDIKIKFYAERSHSTWASSITVSDFADTLNNWDYDANKTNYYDHLSSSITVNDWDYYTYYNFYDDNKTTYYDHQPSFTTCSTSNVYTSSLTAKAPVNFSSNITTSSTIETGRIEKGNHSNQNLDYVDIDFDYYPFKTENIKLLPVSQKPVSKNDLQKLYCIECGRKIKDKFKFCPYCGAKLS